MTVNADDYLAVVTETIGRVSANQREAVHRAADLIADALRADGVVHAFGTGHSEALAMEIAGRAGGLVPTNRIALRDLVLLGGAPADVLGRCWSGTPRWPTGCTSWPRSARRTSSWSPPTPGSTALSSSSPGW
ncbi:SIS domain-containing protein [Micromonospora olivasterospora]|uniref:SIS domain-containing protein n=1 Tax=Micromonospora olivasterospora TaxID=1880 RepID=A0A562I5V3_MICOL|nr:SIS domain-containing protein [Micromonospora olivasterospora]